MTPFHITFYFLNNQRKIDDLEKSFRAIYDQLDLYEKQHSSTIKNYLKSWEEELDELKKRYKKSEKRAQEKYDETIGDNDPEDQGNREDSGPQGIAVNIQLLSGFFSLCKSNRNVLYK